MVDSQPSVIDPNRFYTAEEAKSLLHGRAKIETLRRFGLVSLGKDYLGSMILDAYRSACATLAAKRGLGGSTEEGEPSSEIFDNTDRSVSGHTAEEELSGYRKWSGHRGAKIQPVGTEAGQVESLVDRFDRLEAEGSG